MQERLHEEDVVTVEVENDVFSNRLDMPKTFRIRELKDSIEATSLDELAGKTFTCRVLCQDKPGWRNGVIKVRVEIEFQADEPNAADSFEELRQMNS